MPPPTGSTISALSPVPEDFEGSESPSPLQVRLPNVPLIRKVDTSLNGGEFSTGQGTAVCPPLATTPVTFIDTGNASPRLIRSSIYATAVREMLEQSRIPFVLAVTPFATYDRDEKPPPLLSSAPLRCWKCKGIVSTSTMFQYEQKEFRCAFCGECNDVADCSDDYSIEKSKGCYEYDLRHGEYKESEMAARAVKVQMRASEGFTTSAFNTSFVLDKDSCILKKSMHDTETFFVHLHVDDCTQLGSSVAIQVTAEYTHSDGSRRLRVINLSLPVVNDIDDLYDAVDQETLGAYLLNAALKPSVLSSDNSSIGELSYLLRTQKPAMLPSTLRLQPAYLHTIDKLAHVVRDPTTPASIKAYLREKISGISVFDAVKLLYVVVCECTEDVVAKFPIPHSFADFRGSKLYFIDCGIGRFLWMGRQVEKIPEEIEDARIIKKGAANQKWFRMLLAVDEFSTRAFRSDSVWADDENNNNC